MKKYLQFLVLAQHFISAGQVDPKVFNEIGALPSELAQRIYYFAVTQERDPQYVEVKQFNGHEHLVLSACFDRDEKRILSASGDRTIRLWNVASGRELQTFRGHEGWVNSAYFDRDEKRILSASDDSTIRLWDVASGSELQIFRGHDDVSSACFDRDEKRVLSASRDKTIRLWDVASGRELQIFRGHDNCVNSVCFDCDEKRILSASWDKTIRLWDVASGRELQILRGHVGLMRSACFDRDGTRILSASTIRLWLDPHKKVQLDLVSNTNTREHSDLILYLFLYKKFLQHYHAKVDHISFNGLAKFLNQRDEVTQVTGDNLKNKYLELRADTRLALRRLFDTHYQQT